MDLLNILDFYTSSKLVDETSLEKRMLSMLYDLKVWQNLSDEEKQNRRRKNLKVDQQNFSQEEYYNNIITYEEKVVHLTDLILNFLDQVSDMFDNPTKLEALNEQGLHLFRLHNILLCEKEMINRLPKIKQIGHVPFEIIKPIIQKLISSKFYNLYKLDAIGNLYQEISLMLPVDTIYK